MVPTTVPVFALITVTLGALWLRTNTRSVAESKRMPSGSPWTSIVLIVSRVCVFHMTTGLLLLNPWSTTESTATPWTPDVLATSPSEPSVSRS